MQSHDYLCLMHKQRKTEMRYKSRMHVDKGIDYLVNKRMHIFRAIFVTEFYTSQVKGCLYGTWPWT